MSKENNLSDFMKDLADTIRTKKGYPSTQLIDPQDFSNEIETMSGQQPALFPVVVTGGYNTLSWVNDTRNGGFVVTTVAMVGDTVVTGTSFNITEEDDGKHLVITSSSAGFEDAVVDIELYYMSAQSSLLSVTEGNAGSSYGLCVELSDTSALVPQGYESEEDGKYYSYKIETDETGSGSSSVDFSVAAISPDRPTVFKVSVVDSGNTIARGSGTLTITKNGVEAASLAVEDGTLSFEIPEEVTWNMNDDIEFIINATINLIPPVSKGDLLLIDMDGDGTKEMYRAIKVDGSNVELLGMTNLGNTTFGSTQTYENSALDTYLNTTWYNTLSDTAKAAIVDKTFRQDSWYRDTSGTPVYNGYYGTAKPGTTAYSVSLGNASFGNEITRHVYALSVQDVLDYVLDTNITDGQLQNYNIWKMYWNDEVSHNGEYLWLRSAGASNSSYAMYVFGYYGNVDYTTVSYSSVARPAFIIDISKIEFEK